MLGLSWSSTNYIQLPVCPFGYIWLHVGLFNVIHAAFRWAYWQKSTISCHDLSSCLIILSVYIGTIICAMQIVLFMDLFSLCCMTYIVSGGLIYSR